MNSATPATAFAALLWPPKLRILPASPPPPHTFKLATSPADYRFLADSGFDVILVPRRPSDHFAAPLVVRILGPFIMPWRWRRAILNEGISLVYVTMSRSSFTLAAATWLARGDVQLWCQWRSNRRPQFVQ